MSELVKPQGYTNMSHISQTENNESRYHLRFFQQLPHQTLGQLNGKYYFLTPKGLWQIDADYKYRISANSFRGNYSRKETIQGQKLFAEIRYGLKDCKILIFKVIFLCQKLVEYF